MTNDDALGDDVFAQQKLLLALQHWSLTVLHRHWRAWRNYARSNVQQDRRARPTGKNAASQWLSSLLLTPAPDPPPLPPLPALRSMVQRDRDTGSPPTDRRSPPCPSPSPSRSATPSPSSTTASSASTLAPAPALTPLTITQLQCAATNSNACPTANEVDAAGRVGEAGEVHESFGSDRRIASTHLSAVAGKSAREGRRGEVRNCDMSSSVHMFGSKSFFDRPAHSEALALPLPPCAADVLAVACDPRTRLELRADYHARCRTLRGIVHKWRQLASASSQREARRQRVEAQAELENRCAALERATQLHEVERQEHAQILADVRAECEKARAEGDEIRVSLEKQLADAAEEHEAKRMVLEEKCAKAEQAAADWKARHATDASALALAHEEVKRAESEAREAANRAARRAADELRAQASEHSAALASAQETYHEREIQLNVTVSRLEVKCATLETAAEQADATLKQREAEIKANETTESSLRAQVSKLESVVAEQRELLAAAEDARVSQEASRERLVSEHAAAIDKLEAARQTHASAEARATAQCSALQQDIMRHEQQHRADTNALAHARADAAEREQAHVAASDLLKTEHDAALEAARVARLQQEREYAEVQTEIVARCAAAEATAAQQRRGHAEAVAAKEAAETAAEQAGKERNEALAEAHEARAQVKRAQAAALEARARQSSAESEARQSAMARLRHFAAGAIFRSICIFFNRQARAARARAWLRLCLCSATTVVADAKSTAHRHSEIARAAQVDVARLQAEVSAGTSLAERQNALVVQLGETLKKTECDAVEAGASAAHWMEQAGAAVNFIDAIVASHVQPVRRLRVRGNGDTVSQGDDDGPGIAGIAANGEQAARQYIAAVVRGALETANGVVNADDTARECTGEQIEHAACGLQFAVRRAAMIIAALADAAVTERTALVRTLMAIETQAAALTAAAEATMAAAKSQGDAILRMPLSTGAASAEATLRMLDGGGNVGGHGTTQLAMTEIAAERVVKHLRDAVASASAAWRGAATAASCREAVLQQQAAETRLAATRARAGSAAAKSSAATARHIARDAAPAIAELAMQARRSTRLGAVLRATEGALEQSLGALRVGWGTDAGVNHSHLASSQQWQWNVPIASKRDQVQTAPPQLDIDSDKQAIDMHNQGGQHKGGNNDEEHQGQEQEHLLHDCGSQLHLSALGT